ncbi:MAG: amidohydrolase [Nitrososphaerota archaeon]|nr:amidohydrolase [Nitrososphaerota archaeon]
MSGLLIRGCTLWDGTPGSVYCEGGNIARVYRGEEPDVPADAEVIEASGGSLHPGLIDSHCHPFDYGWLKRCVDLRGTSNVTALRMRLTSGVLRAAPGEWVVGMGWDQEAFPDKSMPSRGDIDDVAPSNPVVLSRICGHIGLLNGEAIRRLGLGRGSGPEYERDPRGELTGIVKETALVDALRMVPKAPERLGSDLLTVDAEAAKLGLTGLHCIVSPEGYREELTALAGLRAAGALSLRYRVYVPFEALGFVKEKRLLDGAGGGGMRLNGVKIFTDGSLGARTAALREPYSDDPGNSGMLRMTDSELGRLVEKVDSLGYQAVVHAIGDRAVEQAVEALSLVTGGGNPRRHRIEHASVVPRDLRSKMARHGIRAAVQPSFVTSDTWAAERLGEERLRDLHPFRSMLEEGIVASGGSDCPVESLSPVLGMWSAMTRGGSVPSESVTLEQALALYTSFAASNGFDELALKEGSPADFTLFDSDIEGMHPALLRKVGVLATVVNGVAVHSYGAG